MIKILIMCMQGMSTSVIENKMQAYADANGIEITMQAIPTHEFKGVDDNDIVVLGPQVKYAQDEIRKKMDATGGKEIPLYVIEAQDFGMMRGDAVMKKILKVLGK